MTWLFQFWKKYAHGREDVLQIDSTSKKGKIFVLPYESLQPASQGNDFICTNTCFLTYNIFYDDCITAEYSIILFTLYN